jgi:polyhydroxybutyrate depolymerase
MQVRSLFFVGGILAVLGYTSLTPGDANVTVMVPLVPDPGQMVTIDPVMCPLEGDMGPGDHTLLVEHDGMLRGFGLHVPPGYDSAIPTPVVVSLHGFGSTAEKHSAASDLDAVADLEGFVTVYPSGFGGTWNAGDCCGAASVAGLDDVGYVEQVIRDVHARLCVDPERIYLTGVSNGGELAHRIAFERPGLVAAVATVSGEIAGTTFLSSRAVPSVIFQGESDLARGSPGLVDDDPWRLWEFLGEFSLVYD